MGKAKTKTRAKKGKEKPCSHAVDGSAIKPPQSASNIGVIFYNKLNMECQVTAIFKSAFFPICNISRSRKFLSAESTKMSVHAFVICR